MPAKKEKDETATKEKDATKKSPAIKKKKTVQNAEVPKRLATEGKTRKRTAVERYTEVPEASKSQTEIKIQKGKGKKLEDCPNVVTQVNKRKRSDNAMKVFHSIVYGGRITKATPLKKNILAFSGFVYDDEKNREYLEERIAGHNYQDIKDVLVFLGQDPSGSKEEVVKKLADFLEKPAPSEEDFTPKKRKRSASRSKSPATKKRKTKAKKDPNAPKRALSGYMLFCKDHRKQVTKENPNKPVTEIAKQLAKLWNKADAKEKKKYEKKHEEAKEEYEKEMKKYKAKSPKTSKKSTKSPKSPKKDKKEKKEKKESSSESSESS